MVLERIANAVKNARKRLQTRPEDGIRSDSFARAKLGSGLRIQVAGPTGQTVETDMPPSVGGEATSPSPGWLMRAGAAACTATVIALRAAELGIVLDNLEVVVSSRSDGRGMFGVGNGILAGPLSASMQVQVSARGVDAHNLRELVSWGIAHSPVADALQRAVPMEMVVSVNEAAN
jgi:uncharacterized OsmC-like protein